MITWHYTGGGANRTQSEVDVLKKGYETFDINLIFEVFKSSLGLQVTGVEKPQNIGLPHITYIVHIKNHPDLVYRGNFGPQAPEIQLLKEKLVSDLALKANIPSNKIILVDISRNKYPFDYQIQEKLEGLDAEKVFHASQKEYDQYSFSLGQLIAKLSHIKLDGFGHFDSLNVPKNKLIGESPNFQNYLLLELDQQIDTIRLHNLISQTTANSIIQLFKNNSDLVNHECSSLVHYDLADHNLRYDPKDFSVCAVYDWEAAIVGDSVLDLASAPTWKTLYPREKKLIEGYLSINTKPGSFEDKLNLYRLRTIIWKVVHNLKFNMATPERILRLATALEPFKLKMKT